MKSDLLGKFKAYIKQHQLWSNSDRLLLACSGGRDSMALAHLLLEAHATFEIAHCNFQLRKEEAQQEEAFVKAFCKEHNVPFHTKTFQTKEFAQAKQLSTQLAARQLRYEWFEELCESFGFDKVLTAHHASDQLETILINFINGTGVKGLKGIAKINNYIVRPLLIATRAEINEYVIEKNIDFKEDSSNASTKYTRNQLRHEVIPQLLSINPALEKHIQDFSERMIESQALIEKQIQEEIKHIVKVEKEITHIDLPRLLRTNYSNTVLHTILKPFGFDSASWLKEVQKLIKTSSGKCIQNDGFEILKHRKQLLIKTIDAPQDFVQISDWKKKVNLGKHRLEISSIPPHKAGKQSKDKVCIDTKNISFPITFRTYQEGDYFYPLGMNMKKKKVKKFFIDQKLSQFDKQDTWIMEDANKKIIWILGHRLDARFETNANSKEVVKLNLQ